MNENSAVKKKQSETDELKSLADKFRNGVLITSDVVYVGKIISAKITSSSKT